MPSSEIFRYRYDGGLQSCMSCCDPAVFRICLHWARVYPESCIMHSTDGWYNAIGIPGSSQIYLVYGGGLSLLERWMGQMLGT